jgi:cytochrome c biogenesis protein CcmG, thiol:disulfide interchange protein DsbE
MNSRALFLARAAIRSQKAALCLVVAIASFAVGNVCAYEAGDTIEAHVLKDLGAHPDKVIVIDFFAEWCGSCRKELPLISDLHDRVKGGGDVQFIGIDTDDSLDVAKAFQKELKEKGDLSFEVVNDLEQQIVGKFKPRGYPALYIIKDGKVASAYLGATDDIDAVIENDLKKLAGE